MPTISPDPKRQALTVVALFCYGLGLFAVIYGFATAARHPDSGLTLLAVGICTLVAGVLVSVRGRAAGAQ